MLRKEALVKIGLYDDSFAAAEDYELWCRFASNKFRLANIKEPLIHYSIPIHEV